MENPGCKGEIYGDMVYYVDKADGVMQEILKKMQQLYRQLS